jgi:hypothetical protein
MAGFNYEGMALITWAEDDTTEQFIMYDSESGNLRVWPESADEFVGVEWQGQMADYPAEHIKFLHLN